MPQGNIFKKSKTARLKKKKKKGQAEEEDITTTKVRNIRKNSKVLPKKERTRWLPVPKQPLETPQWSKYFPELKPVKRRRK